MKVTRARAYRPTDHKVSALIKSNFQDKTWPLSFSSDHLCVFSSFLLSCAVLHCPWPQSARTSLSAFNEIPMYQLLNPLLFGKELSHCVSGLPHPSKCLDHTCISTPRTSVHGLLVTELFVGLMLLLSLLVKLCFWYSSVDPLLTSWKKCLVQLVLVFSAKDFTSPCSPALWSVRELCLTFRLILSIEFLSC